MDVHIVKYNYSKGAERISNDSQIQVPHQEAKYEYIANQMKLAEKACLKKKEEEAKRGNA